MQKPRLENSGGLSANRVIVPIIISLAILHIIIVGLIVSINSASTSLSRTMQDSGTYIEDATSVQNAPRKRSSCSVPTANRFL